MADFQSYIFFWWETHKRDLPWRHTSDPYSVLVSEIMLQQTQVSRVVDKYTQFLHVFPDIHTLADASKAEVIRLWKGLGYNRRALYLKRAAEVLWTSYEGQFPQSEDVLRTLPGIGKYTARAVLVFSFRRDVAMVDTNIRNIITDFFYDGIRQKESVIEQKASELVPPGKSWEWHQALMDYGALELSKRRKISARIIRKTTMPIPFRGTQRFLRGRILDLIREEPMSQKRLITLITKTYGKNTDKIHTAISDMVREGLLTRREGKVSLPR